MEKRLCYCNSCRSFYIIDPGKPCPKCGEVRENFGFVCSNGERMGQKYQPAEKRV